MRAAIASVNSGALTGPTAGSFGSGTPAVGDDWDGERVTSGWAHAARLEA